MDGCGTSLGPVSLCHFTFLSVSLGIPNIARSLRSVVVGLLLTDVLGLGSW